MRRRILIVEDDRHIAKLIAYNLQKADFSCDYVESGKGALAFLEKEPVSLIILDIMLPDMDGFEVCRSLKRDERFKAIPLVMLTARGEELDRVVGLELGAEDYIVKPFSPRELILRIKTVFRRLEPASSEQDVLIAPGLCVDLARHTVRVRNKIVELTAMEFKLLAILLRRRERVQKRDVLLSDVWGIYTDVDTRTVDTHVKRLREKLGAVGNRIVTVRGLGYKFSDIDPD